MIYAYAARSFNLPQQVAEQILSYARGRGLPLNEIIQDQESQMTSWKSRLLPTLLNQMRNGDSLLIYEASDIGASFEEVAEFLGSLVDKEINLHLIKYNKIFKAEENMPALSLIELFRHIESDFIAQKAIQKYLQKDAKKSQAS
ncbi:MAG: hypothetical protein K0Q57_58 [Gammaproteobacteria bacterium]|jgi:DNA invertase Pin-like site-specific DNA recombinase|nr:hypothetical protein [Gammaproteobacteria bacterium]